MSSIESVQKVSTAFLWPIREAIPQMRKSVAADSCCSAIKARALFVAQIICSVVAIPFTLISSIFILAWKLLTCQFKNVIFTLPAAAIQCAYHITFIFGSAIGALAPMSWTNHTIDGFELETAALLAKPPLPNHMPLEVVQDQNEPQAEQGLQGLKSLEELQMATPEEREAFRCAFDQHIDTLKGQDQVLARAEYNRLFAQNT